MSSRADGELEKGRYKDEEIREQNDTKIYFRRPLATNVNPSSKFRR